MSSCGKLFEPKNEVFEISDLRPASWSEAQVRTWGESGVWNMYVEEGEEVILVGLSLQLVGSAVNSG